MVFCLQNYWFRFGEEVSLDKALEHFRKYLTVKCPNLKKSIQLRNGVRIAKGHHRNQVVFESNGLEDSYELFIVSRTESTKTEQN